MTSYTHDRNGVPSLFRRSSQGCESPRYSSDSRGARPTSLYHLPDPTHLMTRRKSNTTCPSANRLHPISDGDSTTNKSLREFFARPDDEGRENAYPFIHGRHVYAYQEGSKNRNSGFGKTEAKPPACPRYDDIYSTSLSNRNPSPSQNPSQDHSRMYKYSVLPENKRDLSLKSSEFIPERRQSYDFLGNKTPRESGYSMSRRSDTRARAESYTDSHLPLMSKDLIPGVPISPQRQESRFEERWSMMTSEDIRGSRAEMAQGGNSPSLRPELACQSTAIHPNRTPERRLYSDISSIGQVIGSSATSFRCQDCNRKCKSEASLLRHATSCTHARGPLALECRYCKRPYTYLGYLHKHETECARTARGSQQMGWPA
ncbi:hypothetical protein CROQUDRAFT_189926 [Cronartium quercuum f. sp. fusiforme G11]|uniref:C2H2-type domain-containing protein n=1 Tax=Cronartium quercuum f. sp. fusiforme G11 TaxID=708437 RepID=A0A9P6NFY1_9BASI|nr:hypothetical protein CROQUDRAFT_189926 [Cronartium quercuum f. sp. fusiforme G11]